MFTLLETSEITGIFLGGCSYLFSIYFHCHLGTRRVFNLICRRATGNPILPFSFLAITIVFDLMGLRWDAFPDHNLCNVCCCQMSASQCRVWNSQRAACVYLIKNEGQRSWLLRPDQFIHLMSSVSLCCLGYSNKSIALQRLWLPFG